MATDRIVKVILMQVYDEAEVWKDTQAFVAGIEASLGRPATTFYGCCVGSEFTIP